MQPAKQTQISPSVSTLIPIPLKLPEINNSKPKCSVVALNQWSRNSFTEKDGCVHGEAVWSLQHCHSYPVQFPVSSSFTLQEPAVFTHWPKHVYSVHLLELLHGRALVRI